MIFAEQCRLHEHFDAARAELGVVDGRDVTRIVHQKKKTPPKSRHFFPVDVGSGTVMVLFKIFAHALEDRWAIWERGHVLELDGHVQRDGPPGLVAGVKQPARRWLQVLVPTTSPSTTPRRVSFRIFRNLQLADGG